MNEKDIFNHPSLGDVSRLDVEVSDPEILLEGTQRRYGFQRVDDKQLLERVGNLRNEFPELDYWAVDNDISLTVRVETTEFPDELHEAIVNILLEFLAEPEPPTSLF